jgi:hypothetical protein
MASDSYPVLSKEVMHQLLDIQSSNTQEVVGHFGKLETDLVNSSDNSPEKEIPNFNEIIRVATGDDDRVAFRTFRTHMWHTHPTPDVGTCEPPSGEDLMQSMSWGYPDHNPEKKRATWELVVASEGLWWYRASPALQSIYFELQDRDEEVLNSLSKHLRRYADALVVLAKNNLITTAILITKLGQVDFKWLANLLTMRPDLLAYLRDEFPLDSMHKLINASPPSYVECSTDIAIWGTAFPGFFVALVDA